jgi:hypothetical protein
MARGTGFRAKFSTVRRRGEGGVGEEVDQKVVVWRGADARCVVMGK